MTLKDCPLTFAIINLVVCVLLSNLSKKSKSSCVKLACYFYIQQCLIAIFQHIEECPRFIRQRIKQHIGSILKTIYSARKRFPEQLSDPNIKNAFDLELFKALTFQDIPPIQYIAEFSFKFNPLRHITQRTLNIYHLRRSLLNKCMPKRKDGFI